MARSRHGKRRKYEGVWNLTSKLLVPKAANVEQSCHPPRLGGAGVVELTAFFGLSKRPASGSVLLAQPPPSISALKVLESSSPRRAVGSSTQCKKT
jgi:hypothetical protein